MYGHKTWVGGGGGKEKAPWLFFYIYIFEMEKGLGTTFSDFS